MRTLLKLSAALSLLLSVIAAAMWVLSQYEDQAWVFEPRPTTPQVTKGRAQDYFPIIGWESHRMVGVSDGRFVWVEQERPVWTVRPTGAKSGLAGYYPPPVPVTMLNRSTYVLAGYEGVSRFRLGRSAEWVSVPSYQPRQWPDLVGRRRYFAVTLLLPAGILAVMPAAVFLRWKRRPRPAFLVVVSGADERAGVPAGSASQTSPPPI